MFVFREEVSSPQQGLLQLCPVVGPAGLAVTGLAVAGGEIFPLVRPGVTPLTLGRVGVRLRPPGPGDGALVGGGLADGGGRGDKSAAASV